MSDHSSSETASLSRDDLLRLFEQISEHQPEPHRCVVHPDGGVCLGCGQPWRRVGDTYEPVTFAPRIR